MRLNSCCLDADLVEGACCPLMASMRMLPPNSVSIRVEPTSFGLGSLEHLRIKQAVIILKLALNSEVRSNLGGVLC